MPSLNDAMSCCPVCLREDVKAKVIRSAIPHQTIGIMMENREGKDEGVHFSCSSCGEFVVTNCDCVNLKSPRLRIWIVSHLSALLREQTTHKLPPFWLRTGIMEPYGPLDWDAPLVYINLDELLQRWPRTVPERIERLLCNLAHSSSFAGDRILITHDDSGCRLAFAENIREMLFHKGALIDQNYCEEIAVSNEPHRAVRLLPAGWQRFCELTRGKSNRENDVFVAMWYGDEKHEKEMTHAYATAIDPAVRAAGYGCYRADLSHHNDWVMDEVLGRIRMAPFVVADFTGNRNGVYFEAGFGRGLGIPVIHTCKKCDLETAHFDTKQLNHVLWDNVDELRLRLYNRILGSIGAGPRGVVPLES